MELLKIEYFLVDKQSPEKNKDLEKGTQLINKVEELITEFEKLGFEDSALEEIRQASLHHAAHSLLRKRAQARYLDFFGIYFPNWKPVFPLIKLCDPNIPSLRAEYEKIANKKDIIRITTKIDENHIDYDDTEPEDVKFRFEPTNGWHEDKLLFVEKEVVSFDQFVEEMKNYKYTKFGTPSKYNQEENTIWEI